MRLKRPSPATVISDRRARHGDDGTAVAAVDFARNSGAVDGKSAVAASSSRAHAAGRLVATNSKGPDKGQLPGKFVAGVVQGEGGTSTFGRAFDVADNAVVAPVPMVDVPGIGRLAASCVDQNKTAGKEDPSTTVTFTNIVHRRGELRALARDRRGRGDPARARHRELVHDRRLEHVRRAHRAGRARTS